MPLAEISTGELDRLHEQLREHDERLDSVEGVSANNREAIAVLTTRFEEDRKARDRMDTGEIKRAEKGSDRMWQLILLAITTLASVATGFLTLRGK